MRLLDRYVFMEVLGPFLFGMAAFNTILFASVPLRRALREFVESNVSARDAGLILLYGLPEIIAWTIPMAMLLAALLGMGRLSGESEAAAMLAGGTSVPRLIAPVLLLGLLTSAASFAFNEKVVPAAKVAVGELYLRVRKEQAKAPDGKLILRQPASGPLERLILADAYDYATSTFVHPDVYFYRAGKAYLFMSADRAVPVPDPQQPNREAWESDHWRFAKGFLQPLGPRPDQTIRSEFTELRRRLGKTPGEVEEELRGASPEQMRIDELRHYLSSLRRRAAQGNELATAQVELHNRYAVPLTSFLFALIGAPLALRPQRTTLSIAFGVTLLCVFLYYVLWYNASWLGANGRLSPLVASWLANAVMAVVGVLLLVRRSR